MPPVTLKAEGVLEGGGTSCGSVCRFLSVAVEHAGQRGRFATTRWSVVLTAADAAAPGSAGALGELWRTYCRWIIPPGDDLIFSACDRTRLRDRARPGGLDAAAAAAD